MTWYVVLQFKITTAIVFSFQNASNICGECDFMMKWSLERCDVSFNNLPFQVYYPLILHVSKFLFEWISRVQYYGDVWWVIDLFKLYVHEKVTTSFKVLKPSNNTLSIAWLIVTKRYNNRKVIMNCISSRQVNQRKLKRQMTQCILHLNYQ